MAKKKAAGRKDFDKQDSGKQDADAGPPSPPPRPDATSAAQEAAPSHVDERAPSPAPFPIIGLGASAGGLEATLEFFEAMPDNSGMAFVVVQHLDPSKPSLTAELLGHRTRMKVTQAADQARVEPNCVYVIPPNYYLSIQQGALRLESPTAPRGAQTAIDFFLRSLAADQGPFAVAIILSGTGADGSLGVRAVKANGGLTIAQAPDTAQHAGMPRSAIATGMMDFVLPIDEMPAAIANYLRHPYAQERDAVVDTEKGKERANFNAVLSLIRAQTKFDFRKYKKNTLARRMSRRMSLHQIDGVGKYLQFLHDHPDEISALAKDMLISVTDFFREPEAWKELEALAIEPLVQARAPDGPIRVWIPGCATGEEAYTVAMLLLNQMQKAQANCPLQIFATDIDKDALETARRGRYPASIAADVPAPYLQRFFVELKDDHFYEVGKALRESVTFAEQNLISDPPFSRLDLICCRNVMIYLEAEVQEKVIALFHFALVEGGHLLLGNAESVGRQSDLFRPVSAKWRIFRRAGVTSHSRLEFPVAPSFAPRNYEPLAGPAPRREMRVAQLAQKRLLERFAPASVMINRNFEIQYFSGPTDNYLTQPPGVPTTNLLERAREGLRTKLRGAVHRAVGENQTVVLDARVRRERDLYPVRVTILPVTDHQDHERLALVVFEEASPRESDDHAPAGPVAVVVEDAEEDSVVRHLEHELITTREDLQAIIEQLETSNEELKASNEEVMSVNEEYQSTNEELETSKEELQSLNEELSTVNAQLASKVEELESKNNDLNNLLSSTDIGTICLDRTLRIRWFTPAVKGLVNLVATDVGRPLADFDSRLAGDELLADAAQVLEKLTPVERELGAQDGRTFLRRTLPYRTSDDRIDGVVILFTDITTRKKAEAKQRQLNEILEQRVAERTELLRVLRDVAVAANEAETVEQALAFTLERVCQYNSWHAGHVYQLADDGSGDATPRPIWYVAADRDFRPLMQAVGQSRLPPDQSFIHQALRTGRACWIARVQGSPQWFRGGAANVAVNSAVAFPILVNRRAVAVLAFYSQEEVVPEDRVSDALENIGLQLGHLIERKDLEKQVAEASAREQRRIGQELHENLGQAISGLGLMATLLAQKLKSAGSPEAPAAEKLVEAAENAKTQVRALIKGVMPIEVEGEGLMAALEDLADSVRKMHELDCRFECPRPVLIKDAFTATNLYLIAREAVHNAVKHSRGHQVVIHLSDDKSPSITIRDDGVGLEASPSTAGQGLRIMRYRAGLIGAKLAFETAPVGGTMVTCTLPASG